jgi:tRNA threonylcarbamoyladenosine biosynthesis protein TsaB
VKGRLIAIEGPDGAGRTTLARSLAEWLRGQGRSVTLLRLKHSRLARGTLQRLQPRMDVAERALFLLYAADLADLQQAAPRLHSSRLVPAVSEALRLAGLAPAAIGQVAVNRGPGSYTGIRIGLAAAEAMGQALGIPVYGVPGLWASAASRSLDGLYAPALDARREDAFCALYEVQGVGLPRERIAPAMRPIADFLGECHAFGRPFEVMGDVVRRQAGLLGASPHARIGPSDLGAARLGLFAMRAREEALDDALSTAALYLRPPAAAARRLDG